MKKVYLNSIIILLIIISFTADFNPSFSQEGEGGWTRLKSMSTARFLPACAYLNGKIYAMGGMDENYIRLGDAEVYDIALNEWTALDNMHQVRVGGSAEVYNDKIYAISGVTGESTSTNVEEYDPATDTWTVLGDMPEIRWGHASCVFNSMVYVLGGYDYDLQLATNSCRTYDPGNDTWDTIASMNYLRGYPACCVYDDKIYIFGGTDVWDPDDVHNKAEVYDPLTDTCEDIKDIPVPMMTHVAILDELKGIVLLMSGNYVYAYDPLENDYTRMKDMPFKRAGFGAIKLNNEIFVLGGADEVLESHISEVWKFNLDSLQEYDPDLIENYKSENRYFSLQQISPNPLFESAAISYELNIEGQVRLQIFNCLGREIICLVNEVQYPGEYNIEWDTEGIKPGIYFCRLQVDGYAQTKKLIVSR